MVSVRFYVLCVNRVRNPQNINHFRPNTSFAWPDKLEFPCFGRCAGPGQLSRNISDLKFPLCGQLSRRPVKSESTVVYSENPIINEYCGHNP